MAEGSYRDKRDLDRSPEPGGTSGSGFAAEQDEPIFVVQEHRSSQHHFDFRLEIDDALASWAVPKGPSLDPDEKRLAVKVEDHPLDYADFEGVIPEGEYGAGTVIVWDRGTYRNLRADKGDQDDGEELSMQESLDDGQVEVWLEGEKLEGGWVLVHARLGGDEDNWMLKKIDDDRADARRNPVSTEPKSVISGRTLDEVAAEEKEGDEDENEDGEDG